MHTDYKQICHQVVDQWQEEKLRLHSGATEEEFVAFEEHYGIKLPDDFKYFYSLVNGMDGSDCNGFHLWALSEIRESNFGVFIDRTITPNKIEIAFGDFLIQSHMFYLVSNINNEYYINVERLDDQIIAASFTKFLTRHLKEPDEIYYNFSY